MGEGSSDDPDFKDVLESAARLQRLIPDAVLVGGSAAALHAQHRVSFDHDHVLADLRDRFDAVLDAIETDDGWALNRLVPGKIILGELGNIETGIRQMIRSRPLETESVTLPSGSILTVPTIDEAIRIKAFLAVRRNQVRDYLDIAGLSYRTGAEYAAFVLARIDDYYADQRAEDVSIASQVVRQLADPLPRDAAVIDELPRYRKLDKRWTWDAVCKQLAEIVDFILDDSEGLAT